MVHERYMGTAGDAIFQIENWLPSGTIEVSDIRNYFFLSALTRPTDQGVHTQRDCFSLKSSVPGTRSSKIKHGGLSHTSPGFPKYIGLIRRSTSD